MTDGISGMGSFKYVNEAATKKDETEVKETEEQSQGEEQVEEGASNGTVDFTFDAQDYSIGDGFNSNPMAEYGFSNIDMQDINDEALDALKQNIAEKEQEVANLAPPNLEDYNSTFNLFPDPKNLMWSIDNKESYEKAKNELEHMKNFLAKTEEEFSNQTGLKTSDSKVYGDNEVADARKNNLVSENFKTLSESEQRSILAEYNIDTNNFTAEENNGTLYLKANDGSEFYEVGIDKNTNKTSIINTKMVDGKPVTKVRDTNKEFKANLDAKQDGAVSEKFEAADEAMQKNLAANLNLEGYESATGANGAFLQSKDGKHFIQVGVDKETGKSQIISTKITDKGAQRIVKNLPETSLDTLKADLEAKQAEVKNLAPPNENDPKYSTGFLRTQYSQDMAQWRTDNAGKFEKAKAELADINAQIAEWKAISADIE